MIDVKNKNKHVGRREVNQSALFNSVWTLCNNFEVHYHLKKLNILSSSQVRKTNVNKNVYV